MGRQRCDLAVSAVFQGMDVVNGSLVGTKHFSSCKSVRINIGRGYVDFWRDANRH